VSEVDWNGYVLAEFTHNHELRHLSTNNEGLVITDFGNHRILLLNKELHLERVLIETDSKVELWNPDQLHYNELKSQLYVLYRSSKERLSSDVISLFCLRDWQFHDWSYSLLLYIRVISLYFPIYFVAYSEFEFDIWCHACISVFMYLTKC